MESPTLLDDATLISDDLQQRFTAVRDSKTAPRMQHERASQLGQVNQPRIEPLRPDLSTLAGLAQKPSGSVSDCVDAARLSRIRTDFLVATADSANDGSAEALSQLLSSMRDLLEMDIAFVSEFVQGRRVFRLVDAAPASADLMQVGQSHALEETYCQRIVDGRLPRAIRDSAQLREADRLDATRTLRIAAYLSAPVTLSCGEVYGTLCCISHTPRSAMGSLQVDALQSVATLMAKELERQLDRR